MNMQGRRFVLGIVAGVLFGLGVVVSSGFVTFGTFGTLANPPGLQNLGTGAANDSVSTASTTSNESVPMRNNTTPETAANSAESFQFSSHLDSIARQPITLTAFVLLPVFAAFLFGLVLYGASRISREEEETQPAS